MFNTFVMTTFILCTMLLSFEFSGQDSGQDSGKSRFRFTEKFIEADSAFSIIHKNKIIELENKINSRLSKLNEAIK